MTAAASKCILKTCKKKIIKIKLLYANLPLLDFEINKTLYIYLKMWILKNPMIKNNMKPFIFLDKHMSIIYEHNI